MWKVLKPRKDADEDGSDDRQKVHEDRGVIYAVMMRGQVRVKGRSRTWKVQAAGYAVDIRPG